MFFNGFEGLLSEQNCKAEFVKLFFLIMIGGIFDIVVVDFVNTASC